MSEQPNNPMNPQDEPPTVTEKVEIAGNQLVERVKELIEQGNVRRIIIRNQDGRILMEIPLTLGAVAGSVLFVFQPLLVGLAAIGALLARVSIEIVREQGGGEA